MFDAMLFLLPGKQAMFWKLAASCGTILLIFIGKMKHRAATSNLCRSNLKRNVSFYSKEVA